MHFHSLYDQGFARVAAASIHTSPAQPHLNAQRIVAASQDASNKGAAVVVFPQLSLSGYSAGDLVLSDALLLAVEDALHTIAAASLNLAPIIIVGAPVRARSHIYDCAVALHKGKILAVVPQRHVPSGYQTDEKRYFATPNDSSPYYLYVSTWTAGDDAPNHCIFGSAILEAADVPGLNIAIEIGEDAYLPVTPGALAALAGASVICHLDAAPAVVGRADEQRRMVSAASARLEATYIYSAAGTGESTTDLAWDGHTMIAECGDVLAQGERFSTKDYVLTIADIDLDRMAHARAQKGALLDNAAYLSTEQTFSRVDVHLNPPSEDIGLMRSVERFPFMSSPSWHSDAACAEACDIQVSALVQRLTAIGNPKVIIGVSGGLDSTHALLVATQAMDALGRGRGEILAYTMPGFATSDATKSNAVQLCESLGIPCETIDITPAARQILADLHHPYADGAHAYDVTFENVQAGLRTDYLFRIANHLGGIVLGTGDLSELALGWCTYGVGDHMSHYGVNAGLPKTMIQHLVRWAADSQRFSLATGEVLQRILAQEISPELIPAESGEKMQSTEDTIGPFKLHDFTLYYTMRGYRPSKIAFLAHKAWGDVQSGAWPQRLPEAEHVAYTLAEIVHWEKVFYRRFFSQQFKRSTLPNGPQVLPGASLSPRGGWVMPSDVSGAAWIAQLEADLKGVPGSGVDEDPQ